MVAVFDSFTGKETKTQRGAMMCPGSPSRMVTGSELELRLSALKRKYSYLIPQSIPGPIREQPRMQEEAIFSL